ncbi:aminotransferase class V-fold PLP-dependent enzyme [Aliidiomarina halalkaliphila]|uniref:Aminotransferase class V-fold PLP-dependent enzyme n=1 Tax=Aliidiomarina halalkaliphila TaxID=2593535 RepID=A0A552X262_9GAMM|nr:aminotransferase class V-fold PLP-dependent enzyme [Aliidiomarina halalkaliphila]TRW49046.1 aminotransferase class V-fold PLP-dependent enzyme [Aliidiomarina halalkaliphila]
MYKHLYSHFLNARPDVLHCAPHSHYYWPDATRAAQLAYWDDSAKHADEKWAVIFGEKVPALQKYIAQELQLPDPQQIVFAQNTHELLYRVFTTFSAAKPLRILTTDGEFHSFNRQSRRLEERGNVDVIRVPCEPFDTLQERWHHAIASTADIDLIFISQVFYNSGVAAPQVNDWIGEVASNTLVMVDGYHGYGAIETDLRAVADRIFYLAGGYKYAQAGEGVCFMAVPKGCELRPEYTGWFADFSGLAKAQHGPIQYANDGMRFAGATMDFSAIYRQLAVFDLWQQQGLTTAVRDGYIRQLQEAFLQHIDGCHHSEVNRDHLLKCDHLGHGHFFTFRLSDAASVEKIATQLRAQGVATDYRNDRLRFGFAMYHNPEDYQQIRFA